MFCLGRRFPLRQLVASHCTFSSALTRHHAHANQSTATPYEAKCILVTAVCASVCPSLPRRIPTLLSWPECNLGNGRVSPSCALLGVSAIDARASLLWQHSANAKCQRVHVLALCLFITLTRHTASTSTRYSVGIRRGTDTHTCVTNIHFASSTTKARCNK